MTTPHRIPPLIKAAAAAVALAIAGALLAATPAAAELGDPPLPAAPSTSTPPKAVLYQAYSHQLTDLGTPHATAAGITVYRDTGSGPVAMANAATYTLNNGLVFDTATGTIARPLTPSDSTDSSPNRYTVVINNGEGGAGAPVAATATTPALVLHDVMVQFTIPVLFADVPPAHTFAPEIYRMAAAGITSGGPSGAFYPDRDVTRQEFARFIVGYLNHARTDLGVSFAPFGLTNPLKTGSCLASGYDSEFPDVQETSPFCTDIKELAAMGITTGYTTGVFMPTAKIKRQEMAAMMYRAHLVAAGFTDPAVIREGPLCATPVPFTDVKQSNVFCGHIEWMDSAAITHGIGGGKFAPVANSTRAMTVTFLDRMGAVDGLTGFGS